SGCELLHLNKLQSAIDLRARPGKVHCSNPVCMRRSVQRLLSIQRGSGLTFGVSSQLINAVLVKRGELLRSS
ncbi:Elongation factor G 2, partial [Dissostichus eleginoides]